METKKTMDYSHATDEEIVSMVMEGNVYPFELLTKRYNQRLYRVARGMNINDADCDDLIQQTFINAYEKIASFRGEAKFSTWLTRILINHCKMHHRKKNVVIDTDIMENPEIMEQALNKTNTNPENDMLQAELKKILEEAIEYLPEDYRTVYLLREVEGMNVKETAQCLAISESNVKIRLFRAKAVLKNYLERYFTPSDIFEFGNHRCDAVTKRVMVHIMEGR